MRVSIVAAMFFALMATAVFAATIVDRVHVPIAASIDLPLASPAHLDAQRILVEPTLQAGGQVTTRSLRFRGEDSLSPARYVLGDSVSLQGGTTGFSTDVATGGGPNVGSSSPRSSTVAAARAEQAAGSSEALARQSSVTAERAATSIRGAHRGVGKASKAPTGPTRARRSARSNPVGGASATYEAIHGRGRIH